MTSNYDRFDFWDNFSAAICWTILNVAWKSRQGA